MILVPKLEEIIFRETYLIIYPTNAMKLYSKCSLNSILIRDLYLKCMLFFLLCP